MFTLYTTTTIKLFSLTDVLNGLLVLFGLVEGGGPVGGRRGQRLALQ